jgi:hypothetical protein
LDLAPAFDFEPVPPALALLGVFGVEGFTAGEPPAFGTFGVAGVVGLTAGDPPACGTEVPPPKPSKCRIVELFPTEIDEATSIAALLTFI